MSGTLSELLSWVGGLFQWWIVVAPWEQAVRVRMGKTAVLLGPGIHLRIPSLDRIYREGVRLRTLDTGTQTVSTADNHTVTIRARVRFRIANYKTVFEELNHAEDTLIDLAMSAIAVEVRGIDREHLTPLAIEKAVETKLHAEEYGLADLGVTITDFAFVRTYRIINEENRWSHGNGMSYTEIRKE